MDLIELIGDEKLYNFHSHTQFCDGRATMTQFAASAVQQGFKYYGFSPHSPIPLESSCNMSMESVPLYIDEVARLKALYANSGTQFFTSMEIDYLGKHWGPANAYFDRLPLDYRIGSVHFIPSQEGIYVDIDGRFERFKTKMNEFFHNDLEYVVRTFYAQSMKMVDEGHFDVIGHFDKIGHNGSHFNQDLEQQSWYQKLVDELIDNIIAHKLIVEINTKAWEEHHRIFPAERYLKRLIENKVPIIVNSDAHYPELINSGRDYAFSLLNQL
jgi:histidinol-phosphatase (PHP family)